MNSARRQNRDVRIVALLLAAIMLALFDAQAQSLSIRAFGATNQDFYGARPIVGFNSKTEMVGVYWEPFNDPRGWQYDASWIWLLEPRLGLPQGYSFVPPPSERVVGDRQLRFVGVDEDGRITANLSGELLPTTNTANSHVPITAWQGSVVRWDGPDSLQVIAGYSKPAEPMIGDIWTRYARAFVSGGSGVAAGELHYVVITNLAYCNTCSPPRVSSIATSWEYRRSAIFDVANGGYRLAEPEGASIAFYSISRLGNFICGLYQLPGDITRAGMWNWTGGVQEFNPPGAPPGLIPWVANELGEIAGTFNTNGHSYYSTNNTVGVFLYLPQAAYGLPAGVNIITNGALSCQVSSMNDRGQFLFSHNPTETNGVQYLWTRGRLNTLQNLAPSSSGWSNLWGVAVNERGAVVGYGEGPYGYANFLARPWIDIEISTSTNRVRPGEELLVHVNFTNRLSTDLHSLNMLGALGMSPNNLARIVSGPEPAGPVVLPSGGGGRFTFRVAATNNGPVTFTAQVRGTNGATTRYTSFIAQSEPVLLADAADLLVKQASDSERAYLMDDRYFSSPSEHQLVTAQVQTNKPGEFDVRIENDSSVARTLRLTATPAGSTNWSNSITLGNQDVTAQVLSAGGLTFTDVEGKGRRQLRVTMALKPSATSQEDQRLRLNLYSDAVPGAVMDLAELRGLRTSIPVIAYLAKLTRNGLTPESIEAGLTEIDAPLVPVANSFLLSEQPLVSEGVVADGVTPLLINMSADRAKLAGIQDGRKYRIDLKVMEGALAGESLQERLRTLSGSTWISSNVVVLNGSQPEAYAYLPGISADDVTVSPSIKEVKVSLKIIEVDTGLEVGSKMFAIRQPPLFLIHGYNTGGDWGAEALEIFGRTREMGTFVQVMRYGQEKFTNANSLSKLAGTDLVNTYYTLNDLVPLALEAYNGAKLKLEPFWAFTRHDVAAHSQGGLLTRMLASQNANPWMPQPFRNRENFYRGRFHRVVTIGSPHNGTRLLRYLLSLLESIKSLPQEDMDGAQVFPQVVGLLMVRSGTAQDKFDPFGPQIRQLNDPAPTAPWLPDPAARFHLVRTSVNHANPPTPLAASLSEYALGLTDYNQPVIPSGSDGVVDWDSMVARGPGLGGPANSFTLSSALLVSHSPPIKLFGSDVGQTDSSDVARHVHAALLQDPSNPDPKNFGPFGLPPLLPDSIRDAIDQWARNVRLIDLIVTNILSSGLTAASADTSFRVALTPPPGLTLTEPLGWTAEVYGTNGVVLDGVTIQPIAGSQGQVQVTVPPGIIGDVVLRVSFRGADGTNYFSKPLRLVRREPPGMQPVALLVEPDRVSLPIGATLPVQVGFSYADGSARLAFTKPNELIVTTDQPAVVDVTVPTSWRIAGAGIAHVTVQHAGLSNTVTVTGFVPDRSYRLPLAITQSGTNQVTLSWPATAPGVLEHSLSLTGTNWAEVTSYGVVTNALRQVTIPLTNATDFFRVQP